LSLVIVLAGALGAGFADAFGADLGAFRAAFAGLAAAAFGFLAASFFDCGFGMAKGPGKKRAGEIRTSV
jgi:hypothetical protein